MTKIQSAVDWAVGIASDSSHGYAQDNRWGPDYDCSSLVISAWDQAGVPVKSKGATYTGNMKAAFLACGFRDITAHVNRATGAGLQYGDVLLHEQNHTAMHIGAGKIVQASINENGGIRNGKTGDQTGGEIHVRSYYNYPWDCVLRLEDGETEPTVTASLYTVQPGDGFWVISQKTLGDSGRWREIAAYNGLSEGHMLHPGDVIKIPGVERPTETPDVVAPASCIVTLPWIKPGHMGAPVVSMQALLESNGYMLEVHGADGDWGGETSAALDLFQLDNRISEEGCGPETWETLIGT